MHFYRSVVDLTSSRFHSPQVSCRAVDAKSNKFTNNRKPTGPKKYANNSLSPTHQCHRSEREWQRGKKSKTVVMMTEINQTN